MCKKCPGDQPGSAEGASCPNTDRRLALPCLLCFWLHEGAGATSAAPWSKELQGWQLGNTQNQYWATLSMGMSPFFRGCHLGGLKEGRQLLLTPLTAPTSTLCI